MVGKDKKKHIKVILVLFMFLLITATSSYTLPSQIPVRVAFLRLESEGISSQLERTINDVLLSFTLEIKGYLVEDLNTTPEHLAVSSSDIAYIFTGKMSATDEGVRLELVFKDKNLKIVRYIAKDYDTSNRVLLDSRVLVKELFESPDLTDTEVIAKLSMNKIQEDIQQDVKKAVMDEFESIFTIDSLAGAWYGEDGEVEKIMIMRGGRGVAIWVSGISLLLDLKLENGVLIITQKGMPQPRQFIDLPDNIANLAAKAVKPIVWQFNINQGLNVLTGLKKTSTITYKNNEIISISEVTIPVQWHRN